MKKKLLLLSIALIMSMTSFAQKQEKIYYDKDWKGCSKSKAEFYRIVNYDENGKPIGKILDYFITGELQAEIEGALNIDKIDDSKSIFFGLGTGFYKSGEKQAENIRDNQGVIVTYKSWYKNGQLRVYKEYKDGKLSGKTKEWDEEGQIQIETDYNNGEINGNFLTYWNNGNVKRIEEYKNGKLISGKCFKISGEEIPFFDYVIYPKFIGGEVALSQYLSKNTIYPEKAKKKKIEGKVLVRFAVNTDGSISNVDILQSAHKMLDKEAIRVVSAMPLWTPGRQDGTAVKVYFALPIQYTLK